jgi:hypothetical protein
MKTFHSAAGFRRLSVKALCEGSLKEIRNLQQESIIYHIPVLMSSIVFYFHVYNRPLEAQDLLKSFVDVEGFKVDAWWGYVRVHPAEWAGSPALLVDYSEGRLILHPQPRRQLAQPLKAPITTVATSAPFP